MQSFVITQDRIDEVLLGYGSSYWNLLLGPGIDIDKCWVRLRQLEDEGRGPSHCTQAGLWPSSPLPIEDDSIPF